jgi:hypothetical protein
MNLVKTHKSYGIEFTDALALIFISFKLAHVITWSWIWVLAPLWVPPLLFLVSTVALVALAAVVKLFKK